LESHKSNNDLTVITNSRLQRTYFHGPRDFVLTEFDSNKLYSTQHAAMDLERRHLQEDHDRLMERHSALLQEMAAKGKDFIHSSMGR
jgi:hypothetical protein